MQVDRAVGDGDKRGLTGKYNISLRVCGVDNGSISLLTMTIS